MSVLFHHCSLVLGNFKGYSDTPHTWLRYALFTLCDPLYLYQFLFVCNWQSLVADVYPHKILCLQLNVSPVSSICHFRYKSAKWPIIMLIKGFYPSIIKRLQIAYKTLSSMTVYGNFTACRVKGLQTSTFLWSLFFTQLLLLNKFAY